MCPSKVSRGFCFSTSHTITFPSLPAETSDPASGEKAISTTPWAFNLYFNFALFMSHTRMVSESASPTANIFPSGEMATAPKFCIPESLKSLLSLPVSTSQTTSLPCPSTSRSLPAATTNLPSGETATDQISASLVSSVFRSLPDSTSQMSALPRRLQPTSFLPSGERTNFPVLASHTLIVLSLSGGP